MAFTLGSADCVRSGSPKNDEKELSMGRILRNKEEYDDLISERIRTINSDEFKDLPKSDQKKLSKEFSEKEQFLNRRGIELKYQHGIMKDALGPKICNECGLWFDELRISSVLNFTKCVQHNGKEGRKEICESEKPLL